MRDNSNSQLSQALGIVQRFEIQGTVAHIEAFGNGHINDTYYVGTSAQADPNYLLQRINHKVFKNIAAVTHNIFHVTDHLRKKLLAKGLPEHEICKRVLTPIPTLQQEYYTESSDGDYWRLYYFIEGTKSYDIVENEKQAYEGGKAFGEFQSMLVDLDSGLIKEVIPSFHDLDFRYGQLQEALARDPKNRRDAVQAELAFVSAHLERMLSILKWAKEGLLPLRITHNDTKFNNVLLDQQDKVLCIVDLDTVMPGYIAYDFGDAIRTIINTAAEDEADLSKISLDLDLFRAFSKGFLEDTHALLTEMEKKSLLEGVLLLPFLMGVRFLTDYINGDVYYKVTFEGHNLQRARAQFQLVGLLASNEGKLREIIAASISR